jgi:quinolinate synthase
MSENEEAETHMVSTPSQQDKVDKACSSTSALHLKRKHSKAPLVVTEVRRSERLKSKSDGYKVASCQSKACFCCATEASTLSSKVIRSLDQVFCKISPRVMTEEALKKKPLAKKSSCSYCTSEGQDSEEK